MKRLALSFVALNALDIGLTLHFVGMGVSTELNPIMARVLTLPLPLVLLYKTMLPALLVAALIAVKQHPAVDRLNVKWVLAVVVIAEVAICLFNLSGLIWS